MRCRNRRIERRIKRECVDLLIANQALLSDHRKNRPLKRVATAVLPETLRLALALDYCPLPADHLCVHDLRLLKAEVGRGSAYTHRDSGDEFARYEQGERRWEEKVD